MRTASWVVVSKASGEAILETFNPRLVAALNTESYDAVPILQWLVSLNRKIATGSQPMRPRQAAITPPLDHPEQLL